MSSGEGAVPRKKDLGTVLQTGVKERNRDCQGWHRMGLGVALKIGKENAESNWGTKKSDYPLGERTELTDFNKKKEKRRD